MSISLVLKHFYFGNRFQIADNDYEKFIWYENTPKPTLEELEAKVAEAEVLEHNHVMSMRRATEYSRVSDPVFFQWQRGEATQEQWLDAVQQVKEQYPKKTL